MDSLLLRWLNQLSTRSLRTDRPDPGRSTGNYRSLQKLDACFDYNLQAPGLGLFSRRKSPPVFSRGASSATLHSGLFGVVTKLVSAMRSRSSSSMGFTCHENSANIASCRSEFPALALYRAAGGGATDPIMYITGAKGKPLRFSPRPYFPKVSHNLSVKLCPRYRSLPRSAVTPPGRLASPLT